MVKPERVQKHVWLKRINILHSRLGIVINFLWSDQPCLVRTCDEDDPGSLIAAEWSHYLLTPVAIRIGHEVFNIQVFSSYPPPRCTCSSPQQPTSSCKPTINNSLLETEWNTVNTNSLISAVALIRADCSTWGHSCYWWHYDGNMSGIFNSRFGLLTPGSARNLPGTRKTCRFCNKCNKTMLKSWVKS